MYIFRIRVQCLYFEVYMKFPILSLSPIRVRQEGSFDSGFFVFLRGHISEELIGHVGLLRLGWVGRVVWKVSALAVSDSLLAASWKKPKKQGRQCCAGAEAARQARGCRPAPRPGECSFTGLPPNSPGPS